MSRGALFTGGATEQIGRLGAAFDGVGLKADRLAAVAGGLRERLEHDATAIRAFGRMVTPEEFGGPSTMPRFSGKWSSSFARPGRKRTGCGRRA